jgi:hypothetical protein
MTSFKTLNLTLLGTAILAVGVGFFSASASAALTEFKFELTPAGLIQEQCRNDDGAAVNSKISIAPRLDHATKLAVPTYIKVKLCLKRFGFRKISLDAQLPQVLWQPQVLAQLAPGQSQVIRGLPSVVTSGQTATATVLREGDESLQIPGQGSRTFTAQVYLVSWKNDQTGKAELVPIKLHTVENLEAYRGVTLYRPEMPRWMRLQISYKVSLLPQPLIMDGWLTETAVVD